MAFLPDPARTLINFLCGRVKMNGLVRFMNTVACLAAHRLLVLGHRASLALFQCLRWVPVTIQVEVTERDARLKEQVQGHTR
jgi:hypothetical protein